MCERRAPFVLQSNANKCVDVKLQHKLLLVILISHIYLSLISFKNLLSSSEHPTAFWNLDIYLT